MAHVLEHTEDLWGELRGGRLFVTGGTAFFGRWTLESLLRAIVAFGLDCSVTILSRDPQRFASSAPHVAQHAAVSLHQGNVRSFDFPDGRYTHVLHMATEAGPGMSSGASFDTAYEGTKRVLEFARARGVHSLLLTSSGAVYGRQPPDLERLPEDYPGGPRPEDPTAGYGHGKRTAEFLCSLAHDQWGLQAKIARCFAFVGPLLPFDQDYAIGNFIGDALSGDRIEVKGDGTARRSYLYGADLAVWLWTILVRGESGRPYNVGSEADISISELAHLVARVFRPDAEVRVARQAVPGALPSRYVPSTARAADELGLRARVNLDNALLRTARWYQAGP